MPSKRRTFQVTKFTPEVIEQAAAEMESQFERIEVTVGEDTTWTFTTVEEAGEGFSMYRSADCSESNIEYYGSGTSRRLRITFTGSQSYVSVRMPTRSAVEKIFSVFDRNLQACRISEAELDRKTNAAFTIFVGHGRSPLWRDLRDHLQDKHGFKVEAFETAPRAGIHVADILDAMEENAAFAVMVMTGENESASGTMHARENVIHETGLFQGALGLHKVIVLLEEGCEEFSNRAGVQYIPFSKGNIKEVFGEVVASIRREFR